MKARYAHSGNPETCIKCRCMINPEDTFIRVTGREYNAELRRYYTGFFVYCVECWRKKQRGGI